MAFGFYAQSRATNAVLFDPQEGLSEVQSKPRGLEAVKVVATGAFAQHERDLLLPQTSVSSPTSGTREAGVEHQEPGELPAIHSEFELKH